MLPYILQRLAAHLAQQRRIIIQSDYRIRQLIRAVRRLHHAACVRDALRAHGGSHHGQPVVECLYDLALDPRAVAQRYRRQSARAVQSCQLLVADISLYIYARRLIGQCHDLIVGMRADYDKARPRPLVHLLPDISGKPYHGILIRRM